MKVLFYVAFGVLLALLLGFEPWWFIPVALTAAIGFGLVSLLRRAINAPRPYEVTGTPPRIPKQTRGRSFPSRHVFSSFLIATLWWPLTFWVSLGLYAAATAIAIIRVKGGVHFPKDVIAGAVGGIVWGVMGLGIGSVWLL